MLRRGRLRRRLLRRRECKTDKWETDIFSANIPQQISKDGEASFGNCFTEKSLDKSGRWKEFGEHIEATMPKT